MKHEPIFQLFAGREATSRPHAEDREKKFLKLKWHIRVDYDAAQDFLVEGFVELFGARVGDSQVEEGMEIRKTFQNFEEKLIW